MRFILPVCALLTLVVAQAFALVAEVEWGNHRTLIVGDDGAESVRVATYDRHSNKLLVFYDAICEPRRGGVFINAANSLAWGPQAQSWSPDSFGLRPHRGIARIVDQLGREQRGLWGEVHHPRGIERRYAQMNGDHWGTPKGHWELWRSPIQRQAPTHQPRHLPAQPPRQQPQPPQQPRQHKPEPRHEAPKHPLLRHPFFRHRW